MNKLVDWLFREYDPLTPEVRKRINRHKELSAVRIELLLKLDREPTHTEIWNEAS